MVLFYFIRRAAGSVPSLQSKKEISTEPFFQSVTQLKREVKFWQMKLLCCENIINNNLCTFCFDNFLISFEEPADESHVIVEKNDKMIRNVLVLQPN